jgi:single-strand DNA-binding protein
MRCENRVVLKGYVGADPEVRHLDGGKVVATFNVATTQKWKDKAGEWKEATEWHRIIAWRWLAERAEEQLKKGTYCEITGQIKTRSYEKDGHKVYVTEIVATDLFSLEKRAKKGGAATDPGTDSGQDYPEGARSGTVNPDGSVTPDDDSDLPF